MSGGDLIWNPYHKVFSYHYMFDFLPKGAPRASYGSSFGVSEIPETDIRQKMGALLADYRAVSVREKSGVELLAKMGVNGQAVLDPVFLIEDHWRELAAGAGEQSAGKYCLVYSLVDYPKAEDAVIRDFAKKRGLRIVAMPANRHNFSTSYGKKFSAGPEEFVSLVANAEHVFTNSSHGLAFAILFRKQFSLLSTVSGEGGWPITTFSDTFPESTSTRRAPKDK